MSLVFIFFLLQGCGDPEPRYHAPADERRGQRGPSGTSPDPRAVPPETAAAAGREAAPPPKEPKRGAHRVGGGRVDVDEKVEDGLEPTPCRVEITTYSEEVIKGVLLERGDDSYQVDVTPDSAEGPRKIRKVARLAIMDEKCRPLGTSAPEPR